MNCAACIGRVASSARAEHAGGWRTGPPAFLLDAVVMVAVDATAAAAAAEAAGVAATDVACKCAVAEGNIVAGPSVWDTQRCFQRAG